jgi:hypothetical protein
MRKWANCRDRNIETGLKKIENGTFEVVSPRSNQLMDERYYER